MFLNSLNYINLLSGGLGHIEPEYFFHRVNPHHKSNEEYGRRLVEKDIRCYGKHHNRFNTQVYHNIAKFISKVYRVYGV